MSIGTEKIRNLAIVGHGGTGKTSLTEQILFVGGAIPKPEPVESGRTVSDFTEEEINQKISIKTSLSHILWQGVKINLLDAPGSGDFFGEVIAALRAAECACILVGAKAGVQIETIKVWRRLEQQGKPRIVFINKMEREQADFKKVLEDLRERFKRPFVPVTVPVGSGPDFKGVIDLLENRFYPVPGQTNEEKSVEIPKEYAAIKEEFYTVLIESAAEGNDELMNTYFEKGSLTPEEIQKGLSLGLRNNRIIPLFGGSALSNSGIRSLLNFLVTVGPSPAGFQETIVKEDGTEEKVPIESASPMSAFCFKTTIDQFSGQLSYLKVITGKIVHDSEALNPREGKKERIVKVFTALGKKLIEIPEAEAGDICVLAKLAATHTNDTLCAPEKAVRYKPLELPTPVFSIAVAAVSKKDEDKLSQLLQRTAEEDKTFRIEYNPETKETIISGMGELQINMILNKIRDGQKIEINTRVPKVAYRETITKNADAVYRHKKQTGGHGQFAEVSIQIRPLPRGEYYAFENAIRGMAVSKGYIPGIEKGLHEAMERGILAGYPVMDIGITLVDGKEHPVDSSEMAFKIAAREALKAAMEKANPVLLEPIMNLSVFVEEQYLGDVLSDLSSRRGRVLGQEPLGGGIVEVKAQVPQAELLRYSIDLKAMTSGTGTFETEFSHYSPITGKVAEEVIRAAKEAAATEAH